MSADDVHVKWVNGSRKSAVEIIVFGLDREAGVRACEKILREEGFDSSPSAMMFAIEAAFDLGVKSAANVIDQGATR